MWDILKIFKINETPFYREISIGNYSYKILKKTNLIRRFEQLLNECDNRTKDYNDILMAMNLKINCLNANKLFNPEELFQQNVRPLNRVYLDSNISYIDYLFPNAIGTFNNQAPLNDNPNFFYTCGVSANNEHTYVIAQALKYNRPVYIMEDCFLRSIFSPAYFGSVDAKYIKSIGFTIDDITHYADSSVPSRLERMLNDKNLVITDEQKQRAENCINKIIQNNLSKYNNQPICKLNIGNSEKPKVLVVDQSYNDYSVVKGFGNEDVFQKMLDKAILENPNADILVKTHPDTMSGKRSGYFTDIKQNNNIYKIDMPINPISLIKQVDKVYVCTTQLGFEACMCGKEVHVFGIPFYANWGITIDEQKCERRTHKRTLEEIFYITYILYSHYVNPKTKTCCEIEDAIDYLIELRNEYSQSL